jgi:hypothetical protein
MSLNATVFYLMKEEKYCITLYYKLFLMLLQVFRKSRI